MASGSKISKKLDIFLAEKFEELKLEDILAYIENKMGE